MPGEHSPGLGAGLIHLVVEAPPGKPLDLIFRQEIRSALRFDFFQLLLEGRVVFVDLIDRLKERDFQTQTAAEQGGAHAHDQGQGFSAGFMAPPFAGAPFSAAIVRPPARLSASRFSSKTVRGRHHPRGARAREPWKGRWRSSAARSARRSSGRSSRSSPRRA
ncbi:MAG: hypothetical protein MZV64_71025 [Ignavibacteriales bacterium]|nr:hypothetical protein [Ignavibacteriales bacterium]